MVKGSTRVEVTEGKGRDGYRSRRDSKNRTRRLLEHNVKEGAEDGEGPAAAYPRLRLPAPREGVSPEKCPAPRPRGSGVGAAQVEERTSAASGLA